MSPGAAADTRSYQVDFGLFRRLAPDHQPRYDILTTIVELEQGLRNMGFGNAEFRESQYVRLNVLTELRKQGLLSRDLSWILTNGGVGGARPGRPDMSADQPAALGRGSTV